MDIEQVGYTALLHTGEHWTEAYGYLGSYYTTFKKAKGELRWLLRTYPEKYKDWAIERIYLQDGSRVRNQQAVVIAQSKDAPIWTLEDERID